MNSELPEEMASLQLQDSQVKLQPWEAVRCESEEMDNDDNISVSEGSEDSSPLRRSLRKRTRHFVSSDAQKMVRLSQNRPVNLNSESEIVNYYMKINKNLRVKQTNLETIFEEPKSSDGNVVTMSDAKKRRYILFNSRPTKAKKVKREAKVKKYHNLKGYKRIKRRKLTLEEVDEKLAIHELSE